MQFPITKNTVISNVCFRYCEQGIKPGRWRPEILLKTMGTTLQLSSAVRSDGPRTEKPSSLLDGSRFLCHGQTDIRRTFLFWHQKEGLICAYVFVLWGFTALFKFSACISSSNWMETLLITSSGLWLRRSKGRPIIRKLLVQSIRFFCPLVH